MVPLTESLYVSGHVHDKEQLLVEIGAGYYAEGRCFRSAFRPDCASVATSLLRCT